MKNSFKKTVVFGSKGLLGSSLIRSLENSSLTESVIGSSRETLDLLDLSATKNFIDTTKPDLVMIAAAKVANKLGIATFALLGRDGGKLGKIVKNSLVVESNTTARIQEGHIFLIHCICDLLEDHVNAR